MHKDQFTATGPAFTGSGFPRAGFSTNRAGADFTHGVNAEGSRCGVFGKSVQQAGSSRESDVEGVGVFGKGDNFGVFGQGNLGMAGVIGTHNNIHRPDHDGVGVIGGVMRGGTGVIGVSLKSLTPLVGQKEIPDSADGDGVGVFGASGTGAGVRGTSDEGTGGEFISSVGSGISGDSDSGVGVEGNSNSEAGVLGRSDNGVGVVGNSDSGVGVVGRSTSGVGAFFNSLEKDAVVGRSGGPGDGVHGIAGSGIGVRGEATTGFGVFGDSKEQSGVVGRSRSAVAPGVFGVCEKLTGVAGRSISAPGVFGESRKQAGVMGRSTSSAGVFGFGDAAFQVSGPPAGVLGINDKSVGVLGSSAQAIGVLGNTDKGLGVVGVANFGASVPTDRITRQGIGVIGLGSSGFGVAGMSTSGTGVFGSSKTSLAGHFKGPVMIEGNVTIVGGTKSAAVPHPDGSHRQLYCMESPESWFEDFGEARLVNGKTEVRFDRGFAALVKLKGYHVFLTPYGDCKGMFVTKRAPTGFRVCEQQGGTSNVSFAYRVVAKRKDVKAGRLAKVMLPEVSKKLQLPDLRLKIKLPDFKRLSVTPFDLPGTLSKRKKPLGPTKRGNVKTPQYSAKKQS